MDRCQLEGNPNPRAQLLLGNIEVSFPAERTASHASLLQCRYEDAISQALPADGSSANGAVATEAARLRLAFGEAEVKRALMAGKAAGLAAEADVRDAIAGVL